MNKTSEYIYEFSSILIAIPTILFAVFIAVVERYLENGYLSDKILIVIPAFLTFITFISFIVIILVFKKVTIEHTNSSITISYLNPFKGNLKIKFSEIKEIEKDDFTGKSLKIKLKNGKQVEVFENLKNYEKFRDEMLKLDIG